MNSCCFHFIFPRTSELLCVDETADCAEHRIESAQLKGNSAHVDGKACSIPPLFHPGPFRLFSGATVARPGRNTFYAKLHVAREGAKDGDLRRSERRPLAAGRKISR